MCRNFDLHLVVYYVVANHFLFYIFKMVFRGENYTLIVKVWGVWGTRKNNWQLKTVFFYFWGKTGPTTVESFVETWCRNEIRLVFVSDTKTALVSRKKEETEVYIGGKSIYFFQCKIYPATICILYMVKKGKQDGHFINLSAPLLGQL